MRRFGKTHTPYARHPGGASHDPTPPMMDAPLDAGSALRPTGVRRFGRAERRTIGVAALALVPFIAVRFLGVGRGAPVVAAAGIGMAIVAAAFFLTWATEALAVVIAAPVALAILALVEVAPEYAFEILLAYRQQVALAAASMTGANRLLLGLGWPLILFLAFWGARRRGQRLSELRLDARHAVTIAYLAAASVCAFVIVLKRSLSLLDSAVLVVIDGLYIYTGLRTHKLEGDVAELEEDNVGVGAATKALAPRRRGLAIAAFLAAGAFVLLLGAEPFMDSLLETARHAGVSEFALIQWVAPFLSEFPESLTAFFWATTVVQAPLGLGNLLSSKLNEWTLLIAAIPIAYSVGAGHTAALALTSQSVDEIFLTAAQSLFGTVVLLRLRFHLRDAILLTSLFLVQFAIPIERVHIVIAWIYLGLAAGYAAVYRHEIVAADVLGNLRTVHLVRRLRRRNGASSDAPR
jgi:cation:H+ antiporter